MGPVGPKGSEVNLKVLSDHFDSCCFLHLYEYCVIMFFSHHREIQVLQENQALRVIRFAIFVAAYLSHLLITKFQCVYSSVIIFNYGLQGPPGITGIKGEVSVLSFINTLCHVSFINTLLEF